MRLIICLASLSRTSWWLRSSYGRSSLTAEARFVMLSSQIFCFDAQEPILLLLYLSVVDRKVFKFFLQILEKGPIGDRTRVGGFKVLSDTATLWDRSTTGTRTRVSWVKASYPNNLDAWGYPRRDSTSQPPDCYIGLEVWCAIHCATRVKVAHHASSYVPKRQRLMWCVMDLEGIEPSTPSS